MWLYLLSFRQYSFKLLTCILGQLIQVKGKLSLNSIEVVKLYLIMLERTSIFIYFYWQTSQPTLQEIHIEKQLIVAAYSFESTRLHTFCRENIIMNFTHRNISKKQYKNLKNTAVPDFLKEEGMIVLFSLLWPSKLCFVCLRWYS